MKPRVEWAATPKQTLFLSCPADEILYGGAAGGGKTDSLLMAAIGTASCGFFTNPNWKALILRRTYPELEKGLIMRSIKLLHGKAKYDAVKHRWEFQGGGLIQFGHVKNDDDVMRHQGSEYNLICFDELTHFTERMYMFLYSRLRTTDKTILCQMLSASNPGGIGHGWVKKRFIDVAAPYHMFEEIIVLPNGQQTKRTRCFIPATAYDNEHLNPGYIQTLMSLPEVERKAFLYGDWNIFSGQFFTEFGEHNICEPFKIPLEWPCWISMDYGYATKCGIGFFSQNPEDETYYMFDEIYVSKTHPDELSRMIKDKLGSKFSNLVGRFADRRIMVKDEETELSTKEKFSHNGIYFTLAQDNRVEGWRRSKELLMRDEKGHVNFKVFNTCENFIRVMPEMIHDLHNVEDIDRKCEAHLPDMFRYFAIMRKTNTRDYETEVVMDYNPVTGYPQMSVNQNDFVSDFRRRNPLVKAGINYFIDKCPDEDAA